MNNSGLIKDASENEQNIILQFPTVYIHNWQETEDYEVYIGESNNVIQRTKQHYDHRGDENKWQHKLMSHSASLYIIGHEHFNKSLTLDIENRLMLYMMSVDRVKKIHNMRGNPQSKYYPDSEVDDIFRMIWGRLRKDNKNLFPSESSIKDSAVFKASPLHKLTADQENIKSIIVQRVFDALDTGKKNQIIFIEGEAGTGKTVLNSSTFYEIFARIDGKDTEPLSCYMMVNHDEQITVYSQIAQKLGLVEKYGEVVCKYWEVMIEKWHKPWNRELEQDLSRKEKRAIKSLSWAEQPQTINEVGSTFTIQGFDLNYAGVILGPSVKYRDGKVVFDPSAKNYKKMTQQRTLSDGTKKKFGETLIQHEVRVLMTRGVEGLYVYAYDKELREALLAASKRS